MKNLSCHSLILLLIALLIPGGSLPAQNLFGSWPVSADEQFIDHSTRGAELASPAPVFTGPARTTASLNPLIIACMNEVSDDSLRAIIQHLQDYGTRYPLHQNRKSIALWLASRFISYGYSPSQVVLDSFPMNFQGNQTWQYNVICTLTGNSAPGDEYHLGGHYDSYCGATSMTAAPGADDNASATAAVLESARVMKKKNFQPPCTIKFLLWAAEEVGLVGSRDYARRAHEAGSVICYYLNLDMVSNDPDTNDQIKVYRYKDCEWAGDLAADVLTRYTGLQPYFLPNLQNSGSDSYSYWINDFPTAYFEEMDFSPNWHRLSDTLGNCNIRYLSKVTQGSVAVIMEQQFLPYPSGFRAASARENIKLSWKLSENPNVRGYNLYRTDDPGFLNPVKVNSALITDSVYIDASIPAGMQFYYRLRIAGDSSTEGAASQMVTGARLIFSDTVLVVSAQLGSAITPDSVRQFYSYLLDSIPFRWFDLNVIHRLDLNTLSRYRNLIYTINSFDAMRADSKLREDIGVFLGSGGNMLFSGFLPSQHFENNSSYPKKFVPGSFLFNSFGIDSVYLKFNSIMNLARPVETGFDSLHTDSLKVLDPAFPGEIFNIEIFAAAQGTRTIYRFSSGYDPSTGFGMMHNRPVGLEHDGPGFRSILLSFPLYYIDTSEAKKFLKYVLYSRFGHPSGVQQFARQENRMEISPNPANGFATVMVPSEAECRFDLSVTDLAGRSVLSYRQLKASKGRNVFGMLTSSLPAGLYLIRANPCGIPLTGKLLIKR